MLDGRRVKVIGLGGIGSLVAPCLVQYLSGLGFKGAVWLIDGDSFEESNRTRVRFEAYGNKSLVKAAELDALARGPKLVPVPRYVTPRNVGGLVEERDVVLMCVDNHATRRCVARRCGRLADILLISGGNDGVEDGREGTFGNVLVHRREAGEDRTNPLTRYHPEIARPADKRPDQMSCGELAQSSAPQLLFTNLAVASAMLNALFAWVAGRLEYEEVYLDILAARMNAVARGPRRERGGG